MPAKRPETRAGSRKRGAAWLLGAACMILGALPSASLAATEPAKPAPVPGAKAAAPTVPTTASKPGAPAGTTAAPRTGTVSGARPAVSEGLQTSVDSISGAPDSKATAGTASRPGVTPSASAATGAQRTASSRPAATTSSRPARASTAPAGPTPARLAASSAGKSRGVQTIAHLDQKLTYQYNALGRRDPFQPMIGGEFVGQDVGGDAPVDVGGMKVVGIVWGTEDKFAMVEDGRGQSMVLRIGDKVMNGVVEGLRRDAVVVRITADGQTQSVAIPLTRKGDKSNATR